MKLQDYLTEGENGLTITGRHITGPIVNPIRSLRYYSVDGETKNLINHNQAWAKTGLGAPRFQFMYMALPTPCNQRCRGCFMGQDKSRLPQALDGPYWTKEELDAILTTAKRFDVRAVVYCGGGELFAWRGAMEFVKTVVSHGLGMVIFTNGALLQHEQIARLAELGVVIILSLRGTTETGHNESVGRQNFRRSLATLTECLEHGMNDGRLAVEMPVTRGNEERVVNDLLPFCRALGIVPWIEEFIQISANESEQSACHDFTGARAFFQRLASKDAELGISWAPEHGTRMADQPMCRRALYSFALFPSGDVMDCPSHSRLWGNARREPLANVLTNDALRRGIRTFEYCPCSTFFTETNQEVPNKLPPHLEKLR